MDPTVTNLRGYYRQGGPHSLELFGKIVQCGGKYLRTREQDSLLRLHGSRCKDCGHAVYPIQRICEKCYSKDKYEKVPMADSKGKIFS
ncbi:MAG: hypothetical protein HGA90_04550, partial [Alphaproteobacteria bacterium]|nr:hypothetical protein [Alphaproteobacteria bacterium]